MSKPAAASASLAPQASRALTKLGSDLKVARQRRRESLRSWAARVGISVPTLQRLEAGDPTVGMGAYATIVWLLGKAAKLGDLVDPKDDDQALTAEIQRSSRSRH